MDFKRRGKPTDNATVESFNGKFREECLNAHWFESIEDARQKIDARRGTIMNVVLTALSRA
jgi:putative transposase